MERDQIAEALDGIQAQLLEICDRQGRIEEQQEEIIEHLSNLSLPGGSFDIRSGDYGDY